MADPDFDSEIQMLEEHPERWPLRRRLVERMLNSGQGTRAAEVVWRAPTIPQEPAELAWAIGVLGRSMPRRAVRLIHAVLEQHAQRPPMLARLADQLEKAGLGMQAARMYGVAQQIDPSLTDAEFEAGLLALDASGIAAAGIAGKGEVVGVLNWVPGGGSGYDRDDPAPEIASAPAGALRSAAPASVASVPSAAPVPTEADFAAKPADDDSADAEDGEVSEMARPVAAPVAAPRPVPTAAAPRPAAPGAPGAPAVAARPAGPGAPGAPAGAVPRPAGPGAPGAPAVAARPAGPGAPGAPAAAPRPAGPAAPGAPAAAPRPAGPAAPGAPAVAARPGAPGAPGVPGAPRPVAPGAPGVPRPAAPGAPGAPVARKVPLPPGVAPKGPPRPQGPPQPGSPAVG